MQDRENQMFPLRWAKGKCRYNKYPLRITHTLEKTSFPSTFQSWWIFQFMTFTHPTKLSPNLLIHTYYNYWYWLPYSMSVEYDQYLYYLQLSWQFLKKIIYVIWSIFNKLNGDLYKMVLFWLITITTLLSFSFPF